MKNQYVGDINDYRKYGLLRILARRLTIGVCWMLTEDDGRPDGLKINYLDAKERWRSHDSDLFEVLYEIVKKEKRRHICEVANRGVIPSGLFYSELLVSEKDARCAYFSSALECLGSSDIIFFDPDNGVRYRLGWARRYVYGDELAKAFRRGNSVLAYQHFPRELRSTFIEGAAERFRNATEAQRIVLLRTPNVLFLLAAQERHVESIDAALRDGLGAWRGHITATVWPYNGSGSEVHEHDSNCGSRG